MLILQVLSGLILGISLTAAQNECKDDRSTLFQPAGSKTTVSCTDNASGDTTCNSKFPGYVCTPGTTEAPICCGLPVDCDAGYVAKYDRAVGDFLMCPGGDADCATAGATYKCQSGMCCTPAQKPPANCDPAFEVDIDGVCKPKANIGQACEDTRQCPGGSGATCDPLPAGTCQCLAPKIKNVNNVCMAEVALGAGPCVDTLQCTAGTCNPATKKCECGANAIDDGAGACTPCAADEVAISNVCEKKKNIGQSCKQAVQCPQGALCQITCACPAGYLPNAAKTGCIQCNKSTQVLVSDVCYPKGTYGTACVVQEQCAFEGGACTGTPMNCQCVASTVWDGTACKPCKAGQVIANNKCYDMSSYGAKCEVDPQCSGYTSGMCKAGQCGCADGTGFNGGGCAACMDTEVLVAAQCLPKVPNGAACMYKEQCSYLNGDCVNKVCACTGTLKYSGTGCGECDGIIRDNLCYPFAARLQPCAYDEQCTKTAGTKCLNKVCECPAGVTCTDVANPQPGACKTTEVKINDQCYPLLSAGASYCYFPQQCTGGSVCINYTCTMGSGGGTQTCTGNTVNISGKGCVAKTTDGVCLNVSCLSIGEAGCKASYAPYVKCSYNYGQQNYFCCP